MTDDSMQLVLYDWLAAKRKFEEAGHSHAVSWILDRRALGLSTSPILPDDDDDEDSASTSSDDDDDGDDTLFDADDESYLKYLNKLDPINTKFQDHYRVLGLSQLRHAATPAQIRRAYRSKIVSHHPDKRRARGIAVKSDKEDYFVCITRAYETLSVKSKRRAYDSVDETFDNSIPTAAEAKNTDFYELFTPVFERNARWSKRHPVPSLGDSESSRDHVEHFYAFWFDFSSWREFSYLDEEDEPAENRYERRYLERQNKGARLEKRREEMNRIRTLVELAYNNDPRIASYKEMDKKRKQMVKQAKKDAAQQRRMQQEMEQQQKLEAERRAKEEAEAKEKARIEMERREREAKKRVHRQAKRRLKELLEARDYFSADDAVRKAERAEAMLRLCESLDNLQLDEFNNVLMAAETEKQCELFDEKVREVDIYLEQKTREAAEAAARASGQQHNDETNDWTEEETRLMVKAIQMFPVGTKQRWEVIANFINEHQQHKGVQFKQKRAKDVIAHAKKFQAMDASKAPVNKDVIETTKKDARDRLSAAPSTRVENGDESKPWTTEEQRLLEQALKTYMGVDDKWTKIAKCVPTRTKKECMRRYKELAELVRAKRAAEQKATKK